MYTQQAPFAVQIEPVEGCPLRCTFCGLSGIRGKAHKYKYMTLETVHAIGQAIMDAGWNVRLELAMHGEPTKHPELEKIIYVLRSYLPKAPIMITSNGAGLVATPLKTITELFAAGLDTLAIDEYHGVTWAQTIRSKLPGDSIAYNTLRKQEKIWKHEYPADLDGNPHKRVKRKRLVFIAPIDTATTGTHSSLNNHCGAGAPLNEDGVGKRCAKPFRELSFRYDGSVAVCCNDWRGLLPIGNINTDSLRDIWQHPRMQAVRKLLYNRQRTMPPCLGCDATSTRVGLLPDKMGKDTLPKPTAKDMKVLAEALATGPLAVPVLRDWEK